jgi:hypothetical protein
LVLGGLTGTGGFQYTATSIIKRAITLTSIIDTTRQKYKNKWHTGRKNDLILKTLKKHLYLSADTISLQNITNFYILHVQYNPANNNTSSLHLPVEQIYKCWKILLFTYSYSCVCFQQKSKYLQMSNTVIML